MPEHVHLLLVPDLPDHPVSRVLSRIKEPFARLLLARWTEIDAPILERITDARGGRHVWQRGGGYDLNLFDEGREREKIDYIHLESGEAGIGRDFAGVALVLGAVSCGGVRDDSAGGMTGYRRRRGLPQASDQGTPDRG